MTGCASAKIAKLPMPPENDRAEVLVYRETAVHNPGTGSLILGINEMDVVELNHKEYVIVTLPKKDYKIFVRSTGDMPFSVSMRFENDTRKCLRAYENPANWAKALLPLAYALGNLFKLEEEKCPSEEMLKKFERKHIEYDGA